MTLVDGRSGPEAALAEPSTAVGVRGEIVAVVLTWRGQIGLFKRSDAVASDRRQWHCITGYLEPGHTPMRQAIEELHEETGLPAHLIDDLAPVASLRIPDPRGGVWVVHPFLATTQRRRLRLNWEHSHYRWVSPRRLRRFCGRVPWLDVVVDAALPA